MEVIKINGKEYHLIRKVYDPFDDCYYYFVREQEEPFCDKDDEIEEI